MKVTVKPVLINEKQILSEMLDQYMVDLEKYANEKFPRPYKYLDAYFSEPSRHPFFIVVDEKNVGVVLVNLQDPLSGGSKQAISEFCVVPEYRSQGIGSKAAQQIFDLFPGTWVIMELKGNPAEDFWKEVIDEYTHGDYIEYEQNDETKNRKVQEFNNSKIDTSNI